MSSIDKSKELGEAVTTQTDKESAIILGSTFSSLDADFEGEVTVEAITGGHVFYSGAAEGHATVGEFLKAYAPVEKANPEHDRKLPEWSSTDSFVADQEGWNLFNLDESRQHGEIQADNEAGVFATDAEAVAFVQQSAEAGSVTAAKALKLAGLPVPQVAFVPSANGVARLICDEIVTYLSKKQLDAVRGIGIKDDAGKRDVDDFCDTNMVIHAAFERFGIHDSDVIIDRYMTIWNDAWDLANGVVFRSEALPPLTAEESRVVQEVVRKPRRSLTVPRVLVTVSGGVANYVADDGVNVEIFDHDDYLADREGMRRPPKSFRDLAERGGVPFAIDPAADGPNLQGAVQSIGTRRVLVIVSGGVAEEIADDGVDVEIFDHDNFKDDPDTTHRPPVHFRDLADRVGVPVDTNPATIDRKLPEKRFDQSIGHTVGGFTVGHLATMSRSKAVGTIVGVKDESGRRLVTLEFDEPQPVDVPEGVTARRFELDFHNISSTWAPPGGLKLPETLSTLEKQKWLESLGYVFSADFKRLDKFTWESVEYGDADQAFDSLDQVIDAAWTHQQQIQNQEEVESLTGGKLPEPQYSSVARVRAAQKAVMAHAEALGIEQDEATLLDELVTSLREFSVNENFSRVPMNLAVSRVPMNLADTGLAALQEADPRPVVTLDPGRPLYDDAGREYRVVSSSSKQVVTNTNGVFGVWDRKTGECLIASCEGARLSNERPSAAWIARRREAAIDVLSTMHVEAVVDRARESAAEATYRSPSPGM